jgi:hypothetical protein
MHLWKQTLRKTLRQKYEKHHTNEIELTQPQLKLLLAPEAC